MRGMTSSAGLVGACLLLFACATPPAPPPITVPPAPRASAPRPPGMLDLADLPGWEQEDHAAALAAFAKGCAVSSDVDLRTLCRRARDLEPADEPRARAFLEANFRVAQVPGQGLMTGYFSPQYQARSAPGGEFTAPVRPLPPDLQVLELGQFDPALAGRKITGRVSADGRFTPYGDRAEIEAQPAPDALAWMRPEELFFMQIQGSGVLIYPDGRRLRAVYAGSNGRPFVGVAKPLQAQGALPEGASGGEVLAWLADHRGTEAQAMMDQDPRYVFFKLVPDSGDGPVGAAGAPLTPGRALAVDPTYHPMGGAYWIDAQAPGAGGGFPAYRRLAMALDVGGAIKGPVRADLYIGSGAEAGIEAGRVRDSLTLYDLVPTPQGAP